MNVVFLGNHTVGVRTLRVIQRTARLAGVVAHPEDPEDGVRYESVFAEAHRLGVPVVRASAKGPELAAFIAKLRPDLLWITDYRYLLRREILELAPLGAVNLHPSLLPAYRGRASINWAILQGETRLGLSAHFVDEGMDTGDVLARRSYELSQAEDVGDALDRLYPLYEAITAEVLAKFAAGRPVGEPQDPAQASGFPRRTPEDGRIDWRQPARAVWNLVRAVAAPYPGAFSARAAGENLRIWKVSGIQAFAPGRTPVPGEILAIASGQLVIACADAAVVIAQSQLEPANDRPLRVGEHLGPALERTPS